MLMDELCASCRFTPNCSRVSLHQASDHSQQSLSHISYEQELKDAPASISVITRG